MICPIRTSNSSPCCSPWLMPECWSIGQRNLDCQPSQITTLWQWVLWSWCNRRGGTLPSTSGTSSRTWRELPQRLWAGTWQSPKGTPSPSPPQLTLEAWSQTLLKLGGTWHHPLIVGTSNWGGDPTSQTHCLAYHSWCWTYSTWPCRHSTRERHHGPFNQTWSGSPRGLANQSSH